MMLKQIVKNPFLVMISLTALLGVSLLHAAENRYYRYKNKEGVTVMNSAIPPEYVQFGYEVVTVAGDVLEVVEPAPTEEELARTATERERKAQLAEWDEYLLKRYSSVKEIERAKERKIEDFQGSMSILKGNAKNIKTQIEAVQARAADIERAGRAVPVSILTNLKALDGELTETERLMALRLEDQQKVEEKFDQDIARFKVIRPEADYPATESPKSESVKNAEKETASVTD